jgi:hypothetical protein
MYHQASMMLFVGSDELGVQAIHHTNQPRKLCIARVVKTQTLISIVRDRGNFPKTPFNFRTIP